MNLHVAMTQGTRYRHSQSFRGPAVFGKTATFQNTSRAAARHARGNPPKKFVGRDWANGKSRRKGKLRGPDSAP